MRSLYCALVVVLSAGPAFASDLQIVTEPAGAEVFNGSMLLGTTTKEGLTVVGIDPGMVTFTISKPGFETVTRVVSVEDTTTLMTVVVRLRSASRREGIPTAPASAQAPPAPDAVPVTPRPESHAQSAPVAKKGGAKTALLILGGAAVVGGGAALAAGGGASSAPPPPSTPVAPQRAIIGVLMDPSPAFAEPSGDSTFPWDFRFNLQVSDSGGVGFTVTSMQTTITSTATGATLFSTAVNPFAGVQIAAFGQETRQYHNGPYRMENFRREGRANVRMNFQDSRGNASSFNGTINILYVGDPERLQR
jgi:PEGA domain